MTRTAIKAVIMVEKLTPIYRGSYELFLEKDAEIRELQQECIEEVARVKAALPKKPKVVQVKKQVAEAVETVAETVVDDSAANIKNNLSQNKNFKMVFGAIAAVGAVAVGAGVLYNKYVKNKAEQIASQQNQKAVQTTNAPIQKLGTMPAPNVSSVFSNFQRIG
jgi:hydrogenase maturation factor HypF (carbamoyltransferase family)